MPQSVAVGLRSCAENALRQRNKWRQRFDRGTPVFFYYFLLLLLLFFLSVISDQCSSFEPFLSKKVSWEF